MADLPAIAARIVVIRQEQNRRLHRIRQQEEYWAEKLRERVVRDTRYMTGQQLTAHLRLRHRGLRDLVEAGLVTGHRPLPSGGRWAGDRGTRHADDHRLRGPVLGHVHPELERLIELEILASLRGWHPPRRGAARPAGAEGR